MQDETKTIGEIRDILDNVCTGVSIEHACTFANCNECKAKAIYNAFYRKVDDMTKEEILQYLKDTFSLDLIDKKEVIDHLEAERVKQLEKAGKYYSTKADRMLEGSEDSAWYWDKQAKVCEGKNEILLYVKHWVEGR